MFERFSDQARRLLVHAQEEAHVLRSGEIDAAHLLLAIAALPGSDAVTALDEMGITIEAVRDRMRTALGASDAVSSSASIPFTPRATKALERGLEESERLNDEFVGTAHILLGILGAKKGTAVDVLRALGVELDRARTVVAALPSNESNAGVLLQRETVVGGHTGTTRTDSPEAAALLAAPASMMPFPPMMGLPQPPNQVCGFCGRDLWDVAHYVHGNYGAICDECVAAAQQVIAAAAEDQHGLTLPPRVFGTVPDPDAPRMIEEAFRTVFGTFATPAHRHRLIEDGENVVPFLEQAQAKFNVRVQGVRVQRVRFVDNDRADVQFALSLSSNNWMPFDGDVVHRDGRWMVSRNTIGRLVQMAGVQLPPTA